MNKDLDWAYLPDPMRKRLQRGEHSRLSCLRLGETYFQRGLRYRDLLTYIETHQLSAYLRDALDEGWRNARDLSFPPLVRPPPLPKRKKPGPKPKPKRRRRQTVLDRYMAEWSRFPRSDQPMKSADLRAMLKASGVPMSWKTLQKRYPNYRGQHRGCRWLGEVLIDREVMLHTLTKIIAAGGHGLQPAVSALIRERVAPPKKRLAKSKLAVSDETTETPLEDG